MHLDNLIEELGAFGRYQIMMAVIIAFAMIVTAPAMLMMGFAGAEPDWWCVSRDHNYSQWKFDNESFKNCQWNGTCRREFSDSMVTVVSEWDLVCELGWVSDAIISVQMAGLLIGAVIAGHCADSYGRKKTFYGGLLLLSVANVITAFSVSWIMFTVMRAVIGIAIGLVFTTFYLYQVEFVGKRWRVFIRSLPDWPMGMILQSLLSMWLHHWKWLHLAVGVAGAMVLPTYFLLHESVRWLTVKGRLDEARHVVNKMASINRKSVPDTSILKLIAEEEKAEGDKAKNYTYFDLLKTKDLTMKTVLTCFGWFSGSIVYYGIYFGVKNLSGDIYMNMLLMALTELPATPLLIISSAVLKRRWSSSLSFILTCAACFGVAACTRFAPLDDRDVYINALAMTAKLTIVVGWTLLSVLGIEQIPTVIRNRAYATHSISARVGGVLAAQVLSLGGNNDLMPPFVAMGVLSFLTVLCCLALEETQGRPLQDTMMSATGGNTQQEILLEPDAIK